MTENEGRLRGRRPEYRTGSLVFARNLGESMPAIDENDRDERSNTGDFRHKIEIDCQLGAAQADNPRPHPVRVRERAVIEPASRESCEEAEHGPTGKGRCKVEPLLLPGPTNQDQSDFHQRKRQGGGCLPDHVKASVAQPSRMRGVGAAEIDQRGACSLHCAEQRKKYPGE